MAGFQNIRRRKYYKVLAVSAPIAVLAGIVAIFYYHPSPFSEPPPITDQVPATSGLEDKIGVEMLFATRSGGREWFMNEGYPNTDDVFEIRDQTIKRMDDGYWYAEGHPPNYQTRIMVQSPAGTDPWKNVEMTGYFREMKTFGAPRIINGSAIEVRDESDYAFQAYARGGIHSDQLMKGSDGKERYLNCVGSAYKGKIYFNGDASVAKEIGHPVYGPERFRQDQQEPSGMNTTTDAWTSVGRAQFEPLVSNLTAGAADGRTQPSRWIGLKVVIYDFMENGKEFAKIQTYIDDKADDGGGRLIPSNEWKLLSDVVDRGDWVADPKPKGAAPSGAAGINATNALDRLIEKCGNPFTTREEYSHMIISWLGHPNFMNDPVYRAIANSASFRWDHSGAVFAYLSVREIGGAR